MPSRTLAYPTLALALLVAPGCNAESSTSAGAESAASSGESGEREDQGFTIGSLAKPIDVDFWFPVRDGIATRFNQFEPGQIYVIEFWGTHCPPCIKNIPHLNDLQRKYADQGVTIVSVSGEDVDTISEFLQQPATQPMGANGVTLTFADIAYGFNMASDPDGSVSEDYMGAVGVNTIPYAFIVGRDGRLEWHGSGLKIDEPLEQVVEDRWDRAAYKLQLAWQRELDEVAGKATEQFRAGETEAAVAGMTRFIDAAETDERRAEAREALLALKVSHFSRMLASEDPQAREWLAGLFRDAGQSEDFARYSDAIAWRVVSHAKRGGAVGGDIVALAINGANGALERLGEDSPTLLETLAHLTLLDGDIDRAIELAERAAAGAEGQMKQSIEALLTKMRSERAGAAE